LLANRAVENKTEEEF